MSESPPDRTWWESPLVFSVFAVVYVATASRHLLGGDAGEFATIFADGGTAHPPGYPLYSLYLTAFGGLPFESPAHGASVATALLGAAAVALLYTAARTWGCDRLEAAFAALATGLAPHVWLYHTSPEVFALNNAVAAAILWVAAPDAPFRGNSRVAVLGVLAGLGIANHHTIIFMAPIGLWGAYCGFAEAEGARLSALGAGIGALALGLAPYGYLPYVALYETGWHWADPETVSGLVDVFLRRDYGTFQMTAEGSTYKPLQQLGLLARTVPLDLYLVPVLVAAVGVARLLVAGVRNSWESRDSYAAWVLVSALLTGPVFACLLTIDPEGVGTLLLRRFHLLPELHLGLLAGLGAASLREFRPRRALSALLVAVIALAAIPRIWNEKRIHHAPAVDQYVRDTFGTLPDDAVVLGTKDHNFFGALYLKRALRTREDIDYIDASLLAHRWYVERLNSEVDANLPHTGSTIQTDTVLSKLVGTGRPVFVTDAFTEGLFDGWRAVPRGTTIRLYGNDRRPPSPLEVYRRNEKLYRSFDIVVPAEVPDHSWRRLVLEDYAATWERIADVLRRAGSPDRAERAARRAAAFRPWAPSRTE